MNVQMVIADQESLKPNLGRQKVALFAADGTPLLVKYDKAVDDLNAKVAELEGRVKVLEGGEEPESVA